MRSDRFAMDSCLLDFLSLERSSPALIRAFCRFARRGRLTSTLSGGGKYNVSANLSGPASVGAPGNRDGDGSIYGIGATGAVARAEPVSFPSTSGFGHDGVSRPRTSRRSYSEPRPGRSGPPVALNKGQRPAHYQARPTSTGNHTRRGRSLVSFRRHLRRALETTSELILEACKPRILSGAVSSFDLNYSAKLCPPSAHVRAQSVLATNRQPRRCANRNEEDLQK